jgi:DNA polymerase
MSGEIPPEAEVDLGDVVAELRRHARWIVEEEPTVLRELSARAVAPLAPSIPRASAVARPAPAPTRPAPAGAPPVASPPRTALAASVAAPSPAPAAALRTGEPAVQLQQIRDDIGDCKRCKLCSGRTKIVFGVGSPKAELVFIGEGPGADEDRTGEPFVGAAGQLLTKMIQAMGLTREQVYICNVVKCRPPGNRDPEPDEIAACEGFLKAQVAAIKPKVVVTLGKFAAQTLLKTDRPISRMRGQWHTYEGIRLMPTFHPSYLLRSPTEKRKAWDDLKLVMAELGLKPGSTP